jgi:hypothetical protein
VTVRETGLKLTQDRNAQLMESVAAEFEACNLQLPPARAAPPDTWLSTRRPPCQRCQTRHSSCGYRAPRTRPASSQRRSGMDGLRHRQPVRRGSRRESWRLLRAECAIKERSTCSRGETAVRCYGTVDSSPAYANRVGSGRLRVSTRMLSLHHLADDSHRRHFRLATSCHRQYRRNTHRRQLDLRLLLLC